jgi:hypothetical protein
MDRYDEDKHVRSAEDNVSATRREDGVRSDRSGEHVPAMRSEEDIVAVDRDIHVSRSGDPSRETVMPPDSDSPADAEMPKREGDILGLGGAVVPKSSADRSTEYDEESTARRRARSAGLE